MNKVNRKRLKFIYYLFIGEICTSASDKRQKERKRVALQFDLG